MSDNAYQDTRGNKDASIANPRKGGEIDSTRKSGKVTAAGDAPFLIGREMTGGYGKGADILHNCTIAVDVPAPLGPTTTAISPFSTVMSQPRMISAPLP